MSARELVLHLGMGKTGSSALQVAFVRNRSRLAELGIHYPRHRDDARAREGLAVSGNGLTVARFLCPRPSVTPADPNASLAAVLREVDACALPSILYSSEMLFDFDPERLRVLAAALTERDVRLRGVIFVRDVAGHALSSYGQMVKRSRYTGSLATYVAEYAQWPAEMGMRNRLEALIDAAGRENVVVGHYDTARKSLLQRFLADVFDVTDLTGIDTSDGEVNRSLSVQEIEWMRQMNARLESRIGRMLVSDQIIKRPPLDPSTLVITTDEVSLLQARFAAEVAWINETFLGGVFRVDGGATIVEERPKNDPPSDSERFLLDCLSELVEAADAGMAGSGRRRRRRAGSGTDGADPGAAGPVGDTALRRGLASMRRRLRRTLRG